MGRFRVTAAVAGLVGLAAAAASAASSAAAMTIAEIASGNDDFTLLTRALRAAGLVNTVADPAADLTVFAPTDEAFMNLARTLGYVGDNEIAAYDAIVVSLTQLGDGDPIPLLTSILQSHVVAGTVNSTELVAAGGFTPLAGPRVVLADDGKSLIDAAPAVDDPMLGTLDIEASNGIVHSITGVLLPFALVATPATPTPAPTPEPTPELEEDDEESDCFPADATVQAADGSVLRMDAVAIGDTLRTSPTSTGRVYFFSHADAAAMRPFVRLTTAAGAVITLSPGHYLPVAVGGTGAPVLAAASTVVVGDALTLASGDRSAVTATAAVTRRGLYAPHMEGGAGVVVDGVWASELTMAVAPAVATPALRIVRAVADVAARLGLGGLRLPSGGGEWARLAPRGGAVVEL